VAPRRGTAKAPLDLLIVSRVYEVARGRARHEVVCVCVASHVSGWRGGSRKCAPVALWMCIGHAQR